MTPSFNTFLIYLTHMCNFSCPYCSGVIDYKSNVMKINIHNFFINTNKIKSFLSFYTDIQTIYLFGGEPTLHPQLNQICKIIKNKNKNINIILCTNLSKDVTYYNNLIDNEVQIIASYHINNLQFYEKIEKLKKIKYIFVMANTKHFNACYEMYQKIKIMYQSDVFFLKIDNEKYTDDQLKILKLSNSVSPIDFNNIPVMTSAGNVYENDDMYINGMNCDDNHYNILKSF